MSIWHQARSEEKRINGIIHDRRKRIEIKKKSQEKTSSLQLLRINGNSMKIHCDPEITLEAESPSTLITWSGDGETIIDRFDARVLLDSNFPPCESPLTSLGQTEEERMCNYEAYKIIVQNEASGIGESFFLSQLANYDYKPKKEKVKRKSEIYYDYGGTCKNEEKPVESLPESENSIKVTPDNIGLLNSCGKRYGICGEDFYNVLIRDRCETNTTAPYRHRTVSRPTPVVRVERNPVRDKINSMMMLHERSIQKAEKKTKTKPEESKMTFIDSFGGEDLPDDTGNAIFDQSVRVCDFEVPEGEVSEKVVRRYRRSPSTGTSDDEVWRAAFNPGGSEELTGKINSEGRLEEGVLTRRLKDCRGNQK